MSGWRSRTRAAVASTAARSRRRRSRLRAGLLRDRAEPVVAPAPAGRSASPAREPARDLGPDARRRSGDDLRPCPRVDRPYASTRIAPVPETSKASARSFSASPTSARSRGRSRRRLADEGAAARLHLPGRAHREERARARRDAVEPRSSPSATCGRTTDVARVSPRSVDGVRRRSTSSCTRSPSPPPRISRAASPTPRATASGSALDVSAYSLVAIARAAEPLMEKAAAARS